MTFCYEGSYDNIFENVSFQIDTDWKLGFIGRNGRGKTTFLNILRGKLPYEGSITASTVFDYFPYILKQEEYEKNTIDVVEIMDPDYELWMVMREMQEIEVEEEVLYRPFCTLSNGEQTKVMLAVLFAKENHFLLIDEPTNHLDIRTREVVRDYLNRKKGFILVSHDKWFLDSCIDHVLVINRTNIEVEKGNFTSWWENKEKREAHERAENEKLQKEIVKLKESARKTKVWADKVESSKIGFDSVKDSTRCIDTRAYLGEKSRRMQQRRKNLERRQNQAIEDKSQLLKNIEQTEDLKLFPLTHHKQVLVEAKKLRLYYGEKEILSQGNFTIEGGERVILQGKNGCGKSSILKAILQEGHVRTPGQEKGVPIGIEGELHVAAGIKVSYVPQDTSWLKGSLKEFARKEGIKETLFLALLRKLDFERVQFEKKIEEFSEGQKKKVLIAKSLCEQAHLYLWDEPLNFIDIFSRMQIEGLIRQYNPTMVIVEHDRSFGDEIGTKHVQINGNRTKVIK